MEKQEIIRRFIPCSLYCTAKIESWLEEMAADGFLLYKFSNFDYAVFVKEKPQKVNYRLCFKGNDKQESEMQKLMQQYGWVRVDEIKNLFVFSSQSPKSSDKDDDCELSELRDKAIKYRSKQNIISLLLPILPIILYIIFREWAISAVNFGLGALLTPISMILFVAAKQIIEIIDIRTYIKHINDNNAYIKNTSKINFILYALKYLSVTVVFLSLIFVIASPDANNDIWYTDETETPPFATVEDFVTKNTMRKSDDTVMYNKWSNMVSSVNYYWREDNDFLYPDGTTERIQLNIDYHETSSSILAKWLIWDYYFKDKSLKITSEVNKISGYEIDYGLTYHNWGYLVVIAQKDNKIIKAEFRSVSHEPFETTSTITDEKAIEIICSNF